MTTTTPPRAAYGGPALALLIVWLACPTPAGAQTATNVRCNGCVNANNIAVEGIRPRNLGNQSVTRSKLAFGAVGRSRIEDEAVSWEKLARALQNRILELEERLATLEANSVLALDGRLRLEEDERGPLVRLEGVNLQLVNGGGGTEAVNGLGNLIVGYDESGGYQDAICSGGEYTSREECEAAGARWAREHKSGSHYLVVGSGHRYSQYGGLVAGDRNTVNGATASAFGGSLNVASGDSAAVTGGFLNEATGFLASVSGGTLNRATGDFSGVAGGSGNRSTGVAAAIAGGEDNQATGHAATVGGGSGNAASGDQASANGGLNNRAEGVYATVGGGRGNSAIGEGATVSAGDGNRAEGDRTGIGGGSGNVASGEAAAVSGGRLRTAGSAYDWVAGGLRQDQ
jgi:hypothetical protein